MAYTKNSEENDLKKAQKEYNERNFDKCEELLNKLSEKSDNPSWYIYLLAGVQFERGKSDDGFVSLERSIEINSAWSNPHTLKAQTIQQMYGQDLNKLRVALSEINLALQYYPNENSAQDVLTNNPENFSVWLKDYVNTSAGMYSLKNSIETQLQALEVLDRVALVENRFEQEKTRNIEVLGVFSAIITLVLSTTLSAKSLQGADFIWLSVGLVIPLGFLILLVSPNRVVKARAIIILGLLVAAGAVVGFFAEKWLN
jgi:tetratricopeptide (TPR) repeat protein